MPQNSAGRIIKTKRVTI